jgi:4-hydroxythreonine-4-phosphate dehydrogenase
MKPTVALTMGDPAGIGSEIIVAGYPQIRDLARPVVIGDASVMRDAVSMLDASVAINPVETVEAATFAPGQLDVLDPDLVSDVEYGVVREDYGAASLAYVERAIDLAVAGDVNAITTAPIHKQATRLAGSEFAGHTDLLADRTGTGNYSMMLIHDDLRVAHVSTHVPLREACDLVTTESVLETIRVTVDGLSDIGIENPRIAVAGLNPHASDGGLLGDAEATEISPAVERASEEGIDVTGPEPPDTVYVQTADGEADCVVAMYHDQGHIPIKMIGFGDGTITGVNMTVGLPIVRSSVDHGTAFDIAGRGIADPTSLVDAVAVAVRAAG